MSEVVMVIESLGVNLLVTHSGTLGREAPKEEDVACQAVS